MAPISMPWKWREPIGHVFADRIALDGILGKTELSAKAIE
jgi:hypothetical protein